MGHPPFSHLGYVHLVTYGPVCTQNEVGGLLRGLPSSLGLGDLRTGVHTHILRYRR